MLMTTTEQNDYAAHQQQPRFQPRAQLPMATRIDNMPKNGEAMQYVLALNPSQADTALRAGLVYRGSYDPAKAKTYGLNPAVNEQLPIAVFSEAVEEPHTRAATLLLIAHPDVDKQCIDLAESTVTSLGAVGDPYGGLLEVVEVTDEGEGLSMPQFMTVHDVHTSLFEMYESHSEDFSDLHDGMPGLMQRAREQLSLSNPHTLASVDFGSAAMVKLVTQQMVERPYRHGGQYDLALQELGELAQFANLLDENFCVIIPEDTAPPGIALTRDLPQGPTQLNLFDSTPESAADERVPNKPKPRGPRM